VFIVDTSPALDRNLIVYSILLDLTLAAWRGVDTRLIIGGSRSNYDIALSAELARSLARVLDIPVRWMTSQKQQGSHAKLVIVDDLILIGSHNWSSGAYGPQTQDSILIQSKAAASYFKSRFELEWQRSGGSNEYI
jgi:phosphatidylserine/phosphatidylglycerophosphate/cardiolipin synthase-like enzyme